MRYRVYSKRLFITVARWDLAQRLVLTAVLLICVISAGDALRAYQARTSTILVIRQGVPEEITRPMIRLFGGQIEYVPLSTARSVGASSHHAMAIQLPADVSVAVIPPRSAARIDGAETVTRYLMMQQQIWDRTVTRAAAVLLVLIGMLVARLMQRELSTLTVLFPLILVVLNGMPQTGCTSCSGYDVVVVQFMTYGIIAVTVLMAVRYWFLPRHQTVETIARWIGCVVPLVQAVALTLVPMFCYKCLISGFLIYASALMERPKHHVVLPSTVRWVLCAGMCIVLLPSNQTSSRQAEQDIVPLYMGSRWEDHFRSAFPCHPVCMVVVSDACRACHQALNALPATGVKYRIARLRTLGHPKGDFVAQDVMAPVPLFLVYDAAGRCRFVYTGWPLPDFALETMRRMVR